MRKIPTLYQRDPDDLRRLLPQRHPATGWVGQGGERATRKYDGTCVRLDEAGAWWARREVKPGKPAPPDWVEVDRDPVTDKAMGWEPIGRSSHAKAFGGVAELPGEPGTYELCGPKVNGNPEGYDAHVLVRHGADVLTDVPLGFDELAAWLADHAYEGVVWHHPDGRLAKIKRRDFPAR